MIIKGGSEVKNLNDPKTSIQMKSSIIQLLTKAQQKLQKSITDSWMQEIRKRAAKKKQQAAEDKLKAEVNRLRKDLERLNKAIENLKRAKQK